MKTIKRPFNRCEKISQLWPALQMWYQTSLGKYLASAEKNIVNQIVSDLFGYHLIQLGDLTDDVWFESSRIPHCSIIDFHISAAPQLHAGLGAFGLPEELPLQSDCVDVMLLLHTLEFSQSPHEILREVERVLIPEGHLVLVAFNNWSLWNIWRLLLGWRNRPPWCGRFLSTTRLRDWLALLGFDVVSIQACAYQPPIQNARLLKHLSLLDRLGRRLWPFFGASKVIVARKRVTTLTAIGPKWQLRRKKIAPAGLVEPFQNRRQQKK